MQISRDRAARHRQLGQQHDMINRAIRVAQDEEQLKRFYNVPGSPARFARFAKFYAEELEALPFDDFDTYDQEDKADFILLRAYLHRAQRNLALDQKRNAKVDELIGAFAAPIRSWCEKRQRVDPINPQEMADSLHAAAEHVVKLKNKITADKASPTNINDNSAKVIAYRAIKTIDGLKSVLSSTVGFYKGYDPTFDWWVSAPHTELEGNLAELVSTIREKILGIRPGDDDAILGDPIGRDGLLTELEGELICYTPEELLQIAEKEYAWCEKEMKKASADLGCGNNWKNALEKVKNMFEPPGAQPTFIMDLVREGGEYVKKNNLVTVPPLAEEGIRSYMISAETQKVSPFFLGGPFLQMSYPTAEMSHAAKKMSMRGNNRYFSRATAFHEMIPGHHLQVFVADRSVRSWHRLLFTTPFYIEGWALYWEMVFWNRGDFFVTPEDKIGSLFWRMHRCVRIVFSLRFHLGSLTAQECVDMLVDRVGHERSTAEGEVRRSLYGDYSPLYQAGYMLGALQIMKLRKEALEGPHRMDEKDFHDHILAEGEMPIEMLRAIILEQELTPDFKSSWKFYDL